MFSIDCETARTGTENWKERVRKEPTLRDRFAMAALTGLLPEVRVQGHEYTLAISAYKIADAMLAVRLRGEEEA